VTPLAIILVLFSAVCHAGWNYLSHGFRRPLVAMWFMTGIGLLLYLPVFVFTSRSLILTPMLAILILISGLTKSGYYITLATTYRYADLSVGYPLSRTGIVLVPIWAYLFLGERISALAGVAIIVILAGIYTVNARATAPSAHSGDRHRSRLGLWAALATALLISVYSVIDKRAMDAPQLGPINFLFAMFVPTWLGITPYVLATNRWAEIKQEISGKMGRLVLMALFEGAIMGATLLGEKHGVGRVAGAVIIFLGALLVSISK